MKRFLPCAVFVFLSLSVFGACAVLKTSVNRGCGEEYVALIKTLDEISYPRLYEKGVFDCSNISALVFDYLVEKGYECDLVVGWTFWVTHAWLIVKKNDCEFWVEPIGKAVVSPNYYWKYIFRMHFDSVEKAKRFYKSHGIDENEWEY